MLLQVSQENLEL